MPPRRLLSEFTEEREKPSISEESPFYNPAIPPLYS